MVTISGGNESAGAADDEVLVVVAAGVGSGSVAVAGCEVDVDEDVFAVGGVAAEVSSTAVVDVDGGGEVFPVALEGVSAVEVASSAGAGVGAGADFFA